MKQLFTIILFSHLITTSFGQTVLTGQLIDLKSNEPIWAGNIYIRGTSIGTVTDSLGYFVVDNILKDTFDINISFIRFYSIDIKNVSSKKDTINLGKVFMLLDSYGVMHIDGVKEIRNKKGKIKRVIPYSETIKEQPEKRKILKERIFYFGKSFNSFEYFQPKSSLNGFEIEYSEFATENINMSKNMEILPIETYKYIIDYIKSSKKYKEFVKWSKEKEFVVSNQIIPIENILFEENIQFDSLKINRESFEIKKINKPLWKNELMSLSDNFIAFSILYFSDFRQNIIVATLKHTYNNDLDYFSNLNGLNMTFIFKLENGKITFVDTVEMWLN